MFSEAIRNTALNGIPSSMNLFCPEFRGDTTLYSTLRVLLRGKTNDYSAFVKSFTLRDTTANEVKRKLINDIDISSSNDCLIICGVNTPCSENGFGTAMTVVKDVLERCGFKEIEKIKNFYFKSFNVRCFENDETHSSVIYVENIDIRKLHFIQCSIPSAMPFYFKTKLNDYETAVLYALKEKTSESYMQAIKNFVDNNNLFEDYIRKNLEGIETRFMSERREIVIGYVNDANNRIKEYERTIKDLLVKIHNYNVELNGLSSMDVENKNEIMNYFINRKNVRLVSVEGRSIRFIATGKLCFFDEVSAKNIINNEYAVIYECCNSSEQHKNVQDLLTAVFIDRVFSINTAAAYNLDVLTGIDGLSGYYFEDYGITDYMPNPHINEYGCTGQNKEAAREMIQNRMYSSALDQCVFSAQQITFEDAAVMKKFGKYILNFEGKCVEDKDGVLHTIKEALEIYRASKGE